MSDTMTDPDKEDLVHIERLLTIRNSLMQYFCLSDDEHRKVVVHATDTELHAHVVDIN